MPGHWHHGYFHNQKANQHLAINLRISANLCAGMGTSAATVAAALLALSHHQGQTFKTIHN